MELKPFAKVFGTDGNQILVFRTTDDDDANPCIRIHFQPPIEGLGICATSLHFTNRDPDVNEARCQKAFDEITEARAREAVKMVLDQILKNIEEAQEF